jgi:hypothetical protein
MINLDLERDEAEALSGALGTVENVNEHLTDAEARADAKVTAALAGTVSGVAEWLSDRYPEPVPGAAGWDDAFPALCDETADMILHEILFEQGFAQSAIDCADNRLAVTLLDMLEAFRGNCWDDQHEGGAHRQDLIDVNRLFGYLDAPEIRDDLDDVLALVADDASDEERWDNRP